MNDSFGALSCGLEGAEVTTYTDSFVSARAMELNSDGKLSPLNRLEDLRGPYDRAFFRIPKTLSFFEDELSHLTRHLKPGAEVACGSMLKHLPRSAFPLLERIIGPTRTSLARKKARLIFAEFVREPQASPYPRSVTLDGFEIPFLHHSNLFSREKLDIGTRFLLEHLPGGEGGVILDIGCGNGVVGIAAQKLNPEASLIFTDESAMAVASARANFSMHCPGRAAEFHWLHSYEHRTPASVDLVLCNPPFHQGHAIGDEIAWQMFVDSRRALRPGGRLRIVGNTHLQYRGALMKIFGNAEPVAKNAKFSIFDAVKRA